MLRTPGAHRPCVLALPPRALLFCPGDLRAVLLPRPAGVGEQCKPIFRGAGEIGHEAVSQCPQLAAGRRRQAVQPHLMHM